MQTKVCGIDQNRIDVFKNQLRLTHEFFSSIKSWIEGAANYRPKPTNLKPLAPTNKLEATTKSDVNVLVSLTKFREVYKFLTPHGPSGHLPGSLILTHLEAFAHIQFWCLEILVDQFGMFLKKQMAGLGRFRILLFASEVQARRPEHSYRMLSK